MDATVPTWIAVSVGATLIGAIGTLAGVIRAQAGRLQAETSGRLDDTKKVAGDATAMQVALVQACESNDRVAEALEASVVVQRDVIARLASLEKEQSRLTSVLAQRGIR